MKSILKYVILASLPLACLAAPIMPAAAQRSSAKNTQELQNALRRIARNSSDSSALADAGLAALELGDTRAAIGFLAKADQIYPRSGRVKAGLARALLEEQNPFGALRYFNDAVSNGISPSEIAADRGLAYDLIGKNADAQKDYELAMRTDSSDKLISRYAVSLGISGKVELAEEKLNPLLRKSDRDAWRNRAFILAMNGRKKDANKIASQTMRRRMAKAIIPFLDRMPQLTAAQKAAAVHFGHFPASENIGVDVASVRYAANSSVRGGDGADAGLIPLGEPLGEETKTPRILAMPDTSARRRPGAGRSKEPRRVSRSELRRLERQGVKYKILSATELPKPTATPAKVPAAQPAVRTAASAPDMPDTNKSSKQPAAEKVAIAKAQMLRPVPSSAAPTRSASAGSVTPGFETRLGVGASAKGGAAVESVEAVATDPVPAQGVTSAQASTPLGVLPPVKSSRPLVSESITRKVEIGSVKPPVTTQPQDILPAAIKAAPATDPVKQQPVPVQMASFDLNSVPKTQPEARSGEVQLAQANPARRPLAEIIKSIAVPDAEKRSDVVPVNLEAITPATAPPKAKPEEKKPEPKQEAPEHPKRYWVQIATGANLNALKYDYRRMAKKHDALFKGNSGWTSPWGKTRRLVVGPFENLSAAKKFEAAFRKGGGDGFAWVSARGTEVNKLTK